MDKLQESAGFLPGLRRGKNQPSDTGASTNQKKVHPARTWGLVGKIPSGPRNHFIAMSGEFVGTFMFLCG